MDADTLISILFVGVIILFQLFGAIFGRLLKQGKSVKDGKTAKAGGLLRTLTERINREVQIAMEQAAKAQQRPSAAAEGKQPGQGSKKAVPRPPQKRTTRFETVDKKPARPARGDGEPNDADLVDELRRGLLQAAVGEMDAAAVAAGDEHAGDALGSPSAAGLMIPSLEGLRRAVIWSEILGPPVALRD